MWCLKYTKDMFISVKTLLKLIKEAEDEAEKTVIFAASWRAILAANGYVYDGPTSGNCIPSKRQKCV